MRAVLIVGVGTSVFGPVSLPEFFSVIVIFSVSCDSGVSETNSWGSSSVNGSDKSNCEFHVD